MKSSSHEVFMRSAAVALALMFVVTLTSGCRRAESQIAAAASTEAAQADGSFTGSVAETMNAGGYTYVRLQAAGKDDVWVAAPEFDAKVGQRLSVTLEMPMRNFESQTLKRRFDVVYFVQSVSRDGKVVAGGAAAGAPAPVQMMTSRTPSTPAAVEPVTPPPGGISIADLWRTRKELSGKEVLVRGRVVKVNNEILGTNWIHLQDGTGSEADRTNDITVTTDAVVQVGEVITVKGILATGKDIGSGYAYDAIIEKAALIK
jgi:hypothetical protein